MILLGLTLLSGQAALAQEAHLTDVIVTSTRDDLLIYLTVEGAYEQTPQTYHWLGRRLFAVDGTKINLPRPLRHADYALPSDQAHYPQGLVSCLYQLKSQIPHDFELASHMNERRLALSHLKTLRPGDVVVYDRGYFSYAMLWAHQRQGVDVVFRLARRAGTLIDAFMDGREIDTIVTLEVAPARQQAIREEHPDIAFRPLSLRLIKYVIDGKTYTLGTTLLDSDGYPHTAFPDLYHARWESRSCIRSPNGWWVSMSSMRRPNGV